MSNTALSVEEITEHIKREIDGINLPSTPSHLYDPIRYILSLGGKRLRPLLALMSHNLFSDNLHEAIMPALSIEVFHNFTLVHDDIMDEAPLRRGQATVHKKWDDNVAILSGDTMLVKAYELLSKAPADKLGRLLQAFNETATGVCEGQQLDMDFERRALDHNPVTEAEYMNMIRLKTSVLFGFSLQLGGITGSGDEIISNQLYDAGVHLGLAFQLQDDLLDLYGGESFGKQVGGDIINAKKSYLLVKALELSKKDDHQHLVEIMTDTTIDNQKKINAVRTLYDQYGIAELTQNKIAQHLSDFNHAIGLINSNRAKNMITFVGRLAHRSV